MNFIAFNKILAIYFFLFSLVFLVYFFSNPKLKTHYQHQVYLARSFNKGHCDLINYPSFYHDIFSFKGKKYTAFSPFPILILVPLTAVFAANVNQFLVSAFIGALNPIVLVLILKELKLSFSTILLTLIAFSLGTLNWYSSVVATSWFFSHTIAVFSLLLALLFLFKKKPFLAGLFFGFSFSSRYPVLISFPAMLWLLKARVKKNYLKTFLFFLFGTIPGLSLNLYYNFCRFGNIWQTGYHYANLAYQNGSKKPIFSLLYLPKNLSLFLFKGWQIIKKFPFLKPDPQGLSIFLVSPFLIFSFRANRPKKIILPLWLGCFLIALLVFSYFLTGWFQFGPRFSLDFLPFLIILTALGMEKIKSNLIKSLFISLSIFLNLLGVYWGLKLGW